MGSGLAMMVVGLLDVLADRRLSPIAPTARHVPKTEARATRMGIDGRVSVLEGLEGRSSVFSTDLPPAPSLPGLRLSWFWFRWILAPPGIYQPRS